jgi:homoserine O-acetyltransferase
MQIGWTLSGPAEGGPAGTPVVLALGGISASRRVFDAGGGRSGWWHEIVGPGKALDTGRLGVLGMDYIGGSEASTGPDGVTPFPSISSYDQADAALRVLDHLGMNAWRQ